MIGARLKLRDFEVEEPIEAPFHSDEELTQARQKGYDEGYQAGLEDAARSHAEGQADLREGIARSLEDMAFTYHEARQAMLKALEPLLFEILEKVLPEAARAALPAVIAETLMPHAVEATEIPALIHVHPEDEAAVQSALGVPAFPVRLLASETLNPGQALIRLGTAEHLIDLSGAVTAIRAAVTGFHHLQQEARHHG